MVVRADKKNRKMHRSRVWGCGNKKHARGKGVRGGVGKGQSRKNKFTYMTAKTPELIHTKGFVPYKRQSKNIITLENINKVVETRNEKNIELPGYKVLSNGSINEGITITARKFSAKALEKINTANGKAITL